MLNYVEKPNKNHFRVEDQFVDWAVDYHKSLPEFKKRKITTFLIEHVKRLFNIRLSEAFVLVNFLFIFLCGILVFYLAKEYQLTFKQSILSVILFYFSFSILLAYFIPIATYDEPIQYFLILFSLLALKKRYYLIFSIVFGLAIIARENSLILLPALFLFIGMIPIKQFLQHKKKALIIVLIYSIPVVFYVIYLMWFFKSNPELVTDSQSAFKLQWTKYLHNFKNTSYSIQTFLSFYSVIALPIFLLISSSIQIKDNINKAFWFTFFLNSLIIFITVYAEESRVFTLPFLLVYPILGKIIIDQYKWEKAFLTYLIKPLNIIIIVCVSVGAWLMFDKLYELTNLICYENLYREYNTLVVLFMTVLLLNTWYKKRLISNSNYSR